MEGVDKAKGCSFTITRSLNVTVIVERIQKHNSALALFLQGLLSGLCGNFDSVTVNDMTTSSHMEVNNAQTFGDSWALGQV